MSYKDFLNSLVYGEALVPDSQYGILGEVVEILTIGFIARDIVGRAPNQIKGFDNRVDRPAIAGTAITVTGALTPKLTLFPR